MFIINRDQNVFVYQERRYLPGREVIDCHAHILPGVDDGSRDMAESLELLRCAYVNGIRTIYCTPHYHRQESNRQVKEVFRKFLRTVREKYPRISAEMDIFLGHELVFHEELPERIAEGEAFPLGDTDRLLIEFDPGTSWTAMFRQIRVLTDAGYVPVVAHMERYEALKKKEHIRELKDAGCLMQVNFSSVTGDSVTGKDALFGGALSPEVRRVRSLIREGWIDLYGTDMHRRDLRPPAVIKQIEWVAENGS